MGKIWELIKDKDGNFSMREITIVLNLLMLVASWIGHQFFLKQVPEFMFYGFISIIVGGVFGYSLERKSKGTQPSESVVGDLLTKIEDK